jgi:hypothetical protein
MPSTTFRELILLPFSDAMLFLGEKTGEYEVHYSVNPSSRILLEKQFN